MLIAQITDIHLGFDPGNPGEYNRQRLDRVVERLAALDRTPDILFATGDLVERGDVESYRRLAEALAPLPFPVHYAMGNHDERANFAVAFPDVAQAEGFYQQAIDTPELRFLVLDTLEEGRHGGAFCEVRAAWLHARLAEERKKPTAIVLHHPPIETGIAWMSVEPAEPWIHRLDAAIGDAPNVVGMICGHIHRAMATSWNGRPLTVCPSTAPQVALTLSGMDPEQPDDRPMIIADAPAYALHWWNGMRLTAHFDTAEEHAVLASFDTKMQPLVRNLFEERPLTVNVTLR